MIDVMTVEGVRLPSGRALTENEWAWVTFLRLASCEADPVPTLGRVQTLRGVFEMKVR
jgi:hypothetical protein